MNRISFIALTAVLLLANLATSFAAVEEAFFRQVAALSVEQQVQLFTETMKKLNPNFAGLVQHKVKADKIVELVFSSAAITDISPVRAFPHIETLRLFGAVSASEKTLADLASLKGLRLSCFEAHGNRIRDLSPLHGMPLRILRCSDNPIKDLSPLKGMPLGEIHIAKTEVTDLSPLRGMPLLKLVCQQSRVTDLSVLRTTHLKLLRCDFVRDRDTKILRPLNTLEEINGLRASEFWERVDKGEAPQPRPFGPPTAPRTPNLKPDEREAKVEEPSVQPVTRMANPELQKSARPFLRPQSSIKGLYVIETGAGMRAGSAQDIIATVERGGSSSGKACDFVADVAKDTRISMEEAERLLKLRYPAWEWGCKVRFSYANKYTKQAGGSAGGAFAVLLLSLLDGFQIDPCYAMTGDVTVDGKIREIGAAAEKIRGAVLEGCKVIAVPDTNKEDLNDLAVLYSPAMLWSAQIFSIATLDDAAAVARVDRSTNLTYAISIFAEVQSRLGKNAGAAALRNASVYQSLREVLRLAPNHLSAEFMLRAANNQLAQTLSLRTSLDEIWMGATPLLPGLLEKDPDPKAYRRFTFKTKIPDDVMKTVSARLGGLQFRIHPKTRDLKLAITEYMTILNQMMHQPKTISRDSYQQLLAKKEKVLGEASNLGTDRKVLEEMMH